MDKTFPTSAQEICAQMCIFKGCLERISHWIKNHKLQSGVDFIKEGDNYWLTTETAQKLYSYYLALTPRY